MSTRDIGFVTHDGWPMAGRLTSPGGAGPHAVVVYVQTAEGMTLDMTRPKPGGGTFRYFDLYAERLPALGIGFFRYEGRGIRNGDQPPRFETIDRPVYDTSSLDNKVRDVMSAVRALRARPEVDASRVYLMGTSEGTLIAADAAARLGSDVAGLVLYAVMGENMRDTFRFIVGDGGFLAYRGFFDTDGDGRISRAEFDADPRGYRKAVWKDAGFEAFDRNGDGVFGPDDLRVLVKPLIDAIDTENFAVLDQWARTSAGVSTPAGWFRDHFSYAPIWTFLARLDVPVGVFHGEADTNTSVEAVRRLEARARDAGKSRMSFHYFPGLDHSLGIVRWFVRGTLPEGHTAMFDYLGRLAAR